MKKLHLSSANKMFAGVCGGIGEYFNIDPSLVRIVWAILSFTTFGTMAVLYLICWAVFPLE